MGIILMFTQRLMLGVPESVDDLKQDIYLLMLGLARAKDEETIRTRFVEGISRLCGGAGARFVTDGGDPGKTTVPVSTTRPGLQSLEIDCTPSQLPSGVLPLIEDAVDILALILEIRGERSPTGADADTRLFERRFEAICVGIVVHTADGSIIYANEAACDILQLDPKTRPIKSSAAQEWYLAQDDGTVIPSEPYPPSEVIRSGKPIRNVITGVRYPDDDRTFWYSMNSEPEFDEQTGQLREVIVTLVDVTALKQTEEALRLSEERFFTAFYSSPDAININRASDGLYIDVNRAFTELLGFTRDEVIGRTSLELNIWRHPEDRAKLVRGLREHGEYMGLEADYRKKSGEIATGIMSARIVNVGGVPCIISVTRDITERKRAEETRRQFEAQMEDQKRQFYRDTILSVTAGKLIICDESDVKPYLCSAEKTFDIVRREDVSVARRQVESYCREQGLADARLDDFMLAVGECITNAIKHGTCGRVYAGHDDGSVWAAIEDKGRGIESLILPQAVLRQGFSTKPSLGLGYSIMLDASDTLMLKTGPSGTTVVLFRSIIEPEIDTSLIGIPDTWA